MVVVVGGIVEVVGRTVVVGMDVVDVLVVVDVEVDVVVVVDVEVDVVVELMVDVAGGASVFTRETPSTELMGLGEQVPVAGPVAVHVTN